MSPDDRAEPEPPKEAEESEDHVGGDSVDQGNPDADGLDALAHGLTGFAEGEFASDSDDEVDLGALAAVAGRAIDPARGADGDARVRMAGLSSIERHSAKLATSSATAATAATATSVPASAAANATPASQPPPVRVVQSDTSPAATQTLAQARAPWVMPLLAGLGLGVGLAGVLFGLSANRPVLPLAPVPPTVPLAASASVPTSVPTSGAPSMVPPVLPQAAAQMHARPEQAPPLHSPIPRPAQPVIAQRSAPLAPQHRPSGTAPAATEPTSAVTSSPRSQAAVLSLHPTEEHAAVPVKTGLDSALDTAAQQNAKAPASRSSVDSLLDEALAAPSQRDPMRAQREAALQQDALPQSPSREDVTKAMTVLLPAIRGCAMGQSGLATASIVVRADGRVAGVEVAGAPFSGTASGRCMEGVIRRAKFMHFKQPIFRIKFPFAIQ